MDDESGILGGRWFKSSHPDHTCRRGRITSAAFCYTVAMSWASRRRFVIIGILGAIALAFFVIIFITVFYNAPSCTDRVQNQEESGVDCGGPCEFLCIGEQRPPTVLFTKVVSTRNGQTDVVALVENVNVGIAAKNVPFTLTLYGTKQVFIQEVTGTFDLPPLTTVPIYVRGIPSGKQENVHAFLSIDPLAPQWFSMPADARAKAVVSNTTLGGTESSPRIDAVLTNASVSALSDVQVIVIIHDTQGEVIAASQTIVPDIPAQGKATATFTWNSAFVRVPAAIEDVPITPLH